MRGIIETPSVSGGVPIAGKTHGNDRIIALAGNPNVGKSTVFNALTGLNQHTGNWPGKTVAVAQGRYEYNGKSYILVDLPGTYSLMAHSTEEEIARDFILSGNAEATIVVCDATCLERNLNLVIQTIAISPHTVVCVNLMDEAAKKGLIIDLETLSAELGVPVIATSARSGEGLGRLMAQIEATIQEVSGNKDNFSRFYGLDITREQAVKQIVSHAEDIYKKTVRHTKAAADARDRKLDRILTSKATGIPIMLLLLCVVFWITITASNVLSALLADALFWVQDCLTSLFLFFNAPDWLHGVLVLGVYRVLAWVVSVMLPPMAIFFPLFTLLEDFGYLPRVAFNLDHHFKKCRACGKQALTMCMGFGCNAAGIVGCRIIDSPRERLIAILTNNFVPCNGRFPTLIAIITMFFVGGATGLLSASLSALLLTGVIILGVVLTFLVSRALSVTILKGQPSSFTLELPPYRTPQFGKVLIRSLLDRTLFVLGRAVMVAAPAGLVIWVFANVTVGDASILSHCAGFLDPFARLMGLDGIILIAFILGFPANEIVVPIIIMAYLSSGTLLELETLGELKLLLVHNGWTWTTAVSTMLFCLIHWPCSTACLTIRKETGSWKWTALAILLPTVIGIGVCMLFTATVRLLGIG